MDKYLIRSHLLVDAIYGEGICLEIRECKGYVSAIGSNPFCSYSRYLLEYIACAALNVHRLTESLLSMSGGGVFLRRHLNESQVFEAIDDFKMMYDFIQKRLKEVEKFNITITLRRTLTRREVCAVLPQLLVDDIRMIKIPTNTLTSYTYGKEFGCYEDSGIYLERSVDISDVVFWDSLVEYSQGCSKCSMLGETEAIVIDRSLFGVIEIEKDCFIYDINDIMQKNNELFYKAYQAKESFESGNDDLFDRIIDKTEVYEDEMETIFPCQINKLTKWLVSRNTDKYLKKHK